MYENVYKSESLLNGNGFYIFRSHKHEKQVLAGTITDTKSEQPVAVTNIFEMGTYSGSVTDLLGNESSGLNRKSKIINLYPSI